MRFTLYALWFTIMSRIGKLPIAILEGVTVTKKDSTVTVKWPKWELTYSHLEWVVVNIQEWEVIVSILSDDHKNLRWLTRTLIDNMIIWVTTWYNKKLQVLWVWYNVKVQWKTLVLNLWYSHPIDHQLPGGIKAELEQDPKWNTVVVISGIDKQLVWEQAAKIRSYRKPEPYKWKWVRYLWEFIQMKAGKTAA